MLTKQSKGEMEVLASGVFSNASMLASAILQLDKALEEQRTEMPSKEQPTMEDRVAALEAVVMMLEESREMQSSQPVISQQADEQSTSRTLSATFFLVRVVDGEPQIMGTVTFPVLNSIPTVGALRRGLQGSGLTLETRETLELLRQSGSAPSGTQTQEPSAAGPTAGISAATKSVGRAGDLCYCGHNRWAHTHAGRTYCDVVGCNCKSFLEPDSQSFGDFLRTAADRSEVTQSSPCANCGHAHWSALFGRLETCGSCGCSAYRPADRSEDNAPPPGTDAIWVKSPIGGSKETTEPMADLGAITNKLAGEAQMLSGQPITINPVADSIPGAAPVADSGEGRWHWLPASTEECFHHPSVQAFWRGPDGRFYCELCARDELNAMTALRDMYIKSVESQVAANALESRTLRQAQFYGLEGALRVSTEPELFVYGDSDALKVTQDKLWAALAATAQPACEQAENYVKARMAAMAAEAQRAALVGASADVYGAALTKRNEASEAATAAWEALKQVYMSVQVPASGEG